MDSACHDAVPVHELQRREEGLEQRVRMLEQEMRGLEEPSTSDYEVRRDDDGEPGETAGLRLSVGPQLCRK